MWLYDTALSSFLPVIALTANRVCQIPGAGRGPPLADLDYAAVGGALDNDEARSGCAADGEPASNLAKACRRQASAGYPRRSGRWLGAAVRLGARTRTAPAAS